MKRSPKKAGRFFFALYHSAASRLRLRRLHVILGGGALILTAIILILISIYVNKIRPPQSAFALEQFTIPLNSSETDVIAKLETQGFIKDAWAFSTILSFRGLHDKIRAGGYLISKSMNAWEIATYLTSQQKMVWVVIPEGVRKEEIADIVGKVLGWTDENKQEFINSTVAPLDHFEGVYFPDTYLFSRDDTPAAIAARLENAFNEKAGDLVKESTKKNIKWTTMLTLASIIQREAAGKEDMPLIAGILWNRLEQGIKLEVDATVQYARGDAGKGWWAPIVPKDEKINSPYNTYLHAGLPPHPISNPGLDAMEAVLNPATTTCIFFIHDLNHVIHCATTYTEQIHNIDLYLK